MSQAGRWTDGRTLPVQCIQIMDYDMVLPHFGGKVGGRLSCSFVAPRSRARSIDTIIPYGIVPIREKKAKSAKSKMHAAFKSTERKNGLH